ncbi:M-phase phosphoprotein 6 [Borealophlyctis nickersoniae]|nr:M-phase phosphoprotein 6 [Borealophlyctis nickersoniae]
MAASNRDVRVSQLSSKVLSMKFMARTQESSRRQKLEEEQRKAASEAQWVLDSIDRDELSTGTQFEYEASYVPFLHLPAYGRRSFNKFNKDIEAVSDAILAEEKSRQQQLNEERESVSNWEMAKRYKQHAPASGITGSNDAGKKRKREKAANDDWSNMAGRQATRFKYAAGLQPNGFLKPPE